MANDLEVLIELLPWLVANNGCSLKEISEQFQVSEKHALELIGQLVMTGPSQDGGGLVDIDFEDAESIFVTDAKALDRPVKLNSFEAASLIAGLHYLEQFPAIADGKVVSGLITKIQSVIPNPENLIDVVAAPVTTAVIAEIEEAIESNVAIEISYAAVSKDDVSQRVIDPVSMYVRDDFTYLKAWCRSSQAWRNFRLDRVVAIKSTSEPSSIPDVVENREATRDYIGVIELDKAYYGTLDQVDILSFKEYMWHAVEVELKVYSRDWLISLVLASGGRMRAVGPPDLVAGVIERAKGWE